MVLKKLADAAQVSCEWNGTMLKDATSDMHLGMACQFATLDGDFVIGRDSETDRAFYHAVFCMGS